MNQTSVEPVGSRDNINCHLIQADSTGRLTLPAKYANVTFLMSEFADGTIYLTPIMPVTDE